MSVKVSIIIPTFNRVHYLKLALESILKQDFQDYEIIISDNASTDNTEEIVKTFFCNKIRYYRNSHNLGPVKNHNITLNYCKGEYVQMFSDDDLMLSDCLRLKVDILNKYPNVGLVHSKFNIINSLGQVIGVQDNGYSPYLKNIDFNIPLNGIELLRILWDYRNVICMPSVMVRHSILKTQKLAFSNNLRYTIDWNLWMKILLFSDSYYINESLIQYRIHDKNDTMNININDRFNEIMTTKKEIILLAENKLFKENFKISKRQIVNTTKKQLLMMYSDQKFGFWDKLAIKLKTKIHSLIGCLRL